MTCYKIVCLKYKGENSIESNDDILIFENNLFGLSVHKEFKDSNIVVLNFYIDKLNYDLVSNLNFLEIKFNRHEDLIKKYFEIINIQKVLMV